MEITMDANAQRMLDLLVTTQKIAEEQVASSSSSSSSSSSESLNNGNLTSPSRNSLSTNLSTKKSSSLAPNNNTNSNASSTPVRNNGKINNNYPSTLTPSSVTTTKIAATPSSSSSSSSSLIPTPGERLIKWGERRDKKIEEERKKTEEERVKQENCTFQPNLSPSTKWKRPSNSHLERQTEWETKRNQKLESLRKEEEYQELAEVSASPRITPRAQASAGHLPSDIKQALHNPVHYIHTDAESVLVRQTNDFNAFLLRQQKARLEKERREAAMARPGTAGGAPHAVRFTGKPTIPTEPHLNTTARAEGRGSTSPLSPRRALNARTPNGTNIPPFNFPYPYITPFMVPNTQPAPVLVPIESLNNGTIDPSFYPSTGSIDPNFPSYSYPIPTLVPISSLPNSNGSEGSVHPTDNDPSVNQSAGTNTDNNNMENSNDPAWSRYAPEIAALLKVSNASSRSGSVVAHIDEELAKEREIIRNSLEKDSLIPDLRPTNTNTQTSSSNSNNKMIDTSRMSLRDLYSNPLPSVALPSHDIYMAAVQAAQQSNFQTRT